jgi:L-asparaginase
MLREVRLLTTGGTIATTTDPVTGRSAPTLGTGVASLTAVDGISVMTTELSSVPSWTLGPAEMARIASAAVAAAQAPGTDGVVVTHGTTTLEYTAFLADLFLESEAPVVFTGAMRRADEMNPDGPGNLADALAVAGSPDARGLGAFVVFAGQILAARHAWKASRSEADAFVDLRGRVAGTVESGRVSIVDPPSPRGRAMQPLLDPNVSFVKVVPGSNGDTIERAISPDTRGLVVEALPGSGGIPPAAIPAVRALAATLPVVVAPRAPFGVQAAGPSGGTGEPLSEIRLLSAGRLSAEQAWLLLMVAIANAVAAGADVRELFTPIASAE